MDGQQRMQSEKDRKTFENMDHRWIQRKRKESEEVWMIDRWTTERESAYHGK